MDLWTSAFLYHTDMHCHDQDQYGLLQRRMHCDISFAADPSLAERTLAKQELPFDESGNSLILASWSAQ